MFPSNPLITRVPFSLIFGFNKETPPKKKGKRGVLLGNLEYFFQRSPSLPQRSFVYASHTGGLYTRKPKSESPRALNPES